MVRIQIAAEVHERPDLDSDVVGSVEAGQVAEVIQQLTDGAGLDWVRIAEGWVFCLPQGDDDDDDDSDEESVDVDEVGWRPKVLCVMFC